MNLRYEQAWDLPVDLFDEGDPITLQAAGGATPAFTAATTGVEALQATLPCDEIPAKGQDLVITWTPAAAPGAKVRWEMTQDIHLYQGPRIRCEVDDSGSLTIPAQMMDAYVHAEKHFLFLTRYHDDVAFPGGNREVAFEVGSQVMCVVNPKHTPW